VVGRVDPDRRDNVFQLSTDTAGRAAAADVPPGTYYVLIEPNRFFTDSFGLSQAMITVVPGQTTDFSFQLPASDWAFGRVTNRVNHKPLRGIEVIASSTCRFDGDLCEARGGYTDAYGYFTIHGLIADPVNWPGMTYKVYLYSPNNLYSPLQKTYTITVEPGLGHEGLDFTRLTGQKSLPSI
ncbi:MAG TPA: hypothetical protein VMZ11_02000, partial [Mycobacteriales bacterium]|nr:hypothetical protein [Mycobacteriales bacterium]